MRYDFLTEFKIETPTIPITNKDTKETAIHRSKLNLMGLCRDFVSLLVIGIVGVSILNSVRKSYLISNDFDYTTAIIDFERSSLDRLIVSYEVNQNEYIKRMDVSFNEVVKLSKDRIVLRFARINPLICEVVLKSDSVKFNNPKFLE